MSRRTAQPACPAPSGSRAGRSASFEARRRRAAAVEVDVGLAYAAADGEDAVAGEHAAAGEKPAVLPVGEAQFRPVQGVLAVDPAGEAVADEGRVDGLVEALVGGRILGDQAGG